MRAQQELRLVLLSPAYQPLFVDQNVLVLTKLDLIHLDDLWLQLKLLGHLHQTHPFQPIIDLKFVHAHHYRHLSQLLADDQLHQFHL